jgi:sugar O-acyltransferase (sialic acid O-acetyltransferase NeuD family)
MKSLLIVGAGGHGGVVADAAHASGAWQEIAFLDDTPDAGPVHGQWPVLGPAALAASLRPRFPAALVAIGNAQTRLLRLDELAGLGYELPVVRHPLSAVGVNVRLGPGTVILAGAVINSGTRVGRGCIVNSSASVDHDCLLGEGVHVCPGAHVAGDVQVGSRSWLGIGCCVRQGTRIGEGVTIGAGAAVVGDVPDLATVVGVPAKELKR